MSTHTNKKNQLLKASLNLFAHSGCDAVSTKKIAETAHVSEGLLFRHFKNKEGLIQTLYEFESELVLKRLDPILDLSHPKVVLREILSLPFQIKENHFEFYKWYLSLLEYRFKGVSIIEQKLTYKSQQAFRTLQYENVEIEDKTFWIIFHGLTTAIIRNPKNNFINVYDCIRQKYNV